MKRVGIYVRVSSREQAQEGYSIDAQIRKLNLYCDAMEWKERVVYEDAGYSAKDTNRPAFQQLKDDIKAGKIDVLLVYRLDRMTRSVRDLFDILSYLDEFNCTFKSSSENYDTSTAMGRMFIGLVGLLAQWERENLGERVVMGMREKVVAKKEASGQQPYGFKIENKKRIVDDIEKENVLLMIDIFRKQKSMIAVSRELNRLNIPTRSQKTQWSHQTVRQILRNPALYGCMTYDGELIENYSEGIITKEQFINLNKDLEKQNTLRLRAPARGLFSGLLICPVCQSTLVKSSARYRCNACQENQVGTMRVNENQMVEALKKYLRDLKIDKSETKEQLPKRNFENDFKRLKEMRMKYQQMYASDLMTFEELQTHIETLEIEKSKLEIELIEYENYNNFNTVEEIENFKILFAENFDMLTHDEKIDFMMMFISRIEFKRTCIKYDKHGVPAAYEYTITHVELRRL